MKKVLVSVLTLALASIGAVQAQNSFSLRFGLAMPTSNYADAMADYSNDVLRYGLQDNSKKGGAGIGFSAGMQVNLGVKSVKGLGVILSGDVFYNSTNSDVVDFFEEFVDDNEGTNYEISFLTPKYIHIPLMAGLSYTFDLKDNVAIFGEGALGANVRIITELEEYQATTTQERIDTWYYNAATSFAYRVGAGVVFNKKYSLGVDFYNHGTAKAEGEKVTEQNGVTQNGTLKFKGGKITGTNVAIRFGIKF